MWDIKYRPKVFGDVLGQEGATQVLQARLRDGKAFDTSYIFAGGHGCGKTTLSRIYARSMLCQKRGEDGNPCNECDNCKACLTETMPAFVETDAASRGTTADMRQLVEDLAFPIPGAPKRIYLLDEAHRMSKDAQDVLLKPIEDKRVVIIFCTTELPKIRGTIGSRCEIHEIRKIDRADILQRMKGVLEAEQVQYEEDAVLTVIDLSKGHVRDTLKKLETVAQLGSVTTASVREILNLSVITTYFDILLSLGEPARTLALVEEACDRVGPSDVASGLAEAAMNAYRHANKMYADFSLFDRASAEKVHEMYGVNLPSLARYFLRNPYPSRLSLTCDVVELCESGGRVVTASPAPVAAPVKVQAAAPAPSPSPAPVASPVPVATPVVTPPPEVAPPPPPPAPAPVQQAPTPAPPPQEAPAPEPIVDNRLGSMGLKSIPDKHPRGSQKHRTPKNGTKVTSKEETRSVSNPEFRSLFNEYRSLNRG